MTLQKYYYNEIKIPQNISITLEPHKDKTPIEYIMWRYRLGYDREQSNKNALTLSDEEINRDKYSDRNFFGE